MTDFTFINHTREQTQYREQLGFLGKKRNRFLSLFSRKPQAVPLCWVATTQHYPFANLGDALSPVIVSALSSLPIAHRHFDARKPKLACVGTIAQNFRSGTVHFWGTGVDCQKDFSYQKSDFSSSILNTKFRVHALRGPVSARHFKRHGFQAPAIYGDPVWFLPSIIKPAPTKRYELGIVVHLSELSQLTDTAALKQHLVRYIIPESLAKDIRIIPTLIPPTFEAIERKVQEITACQRIISTSLHGLVIAEAYGIPCVHLRNDEKRATFVQLQDETERIDLRIRDFYAGVNVERLFVYGQRQQDRTNWDDVLQAIDTNWQPIHWSAESFLEAFPLPLTFNPLKEKFLGDRMQFRPIKF